MPCPYCGQCHPGIKHIISNHKARLFLMDDRLSEETRYFPIYKPMPKHYWLDIKLRERQQRLQDVDSYKPFIQEGQADKGGGK